jgi:hypothetical protein
MSSIKLFQIINTTFSILLQKYGYYSSKYNAYTQGTLKRQVSLEDDL